MAIGARRENAEDGLRVHRENTGDEDPTDTVGISGIGDTITGTVLGAPVDIDAGEIYTGINETRRYAAFVQVQRSTSPWKPGTYG